jgi:hypothetical protein
VVNAPVPRPWIRVGFVILFTIFVVTTFAPVLWSLWYAYEALSPPAPVHKTPINTASIAAIDKRIAFSTSMFQAGLLVLAGLWGLVFAEHAKAYSALNEWPEVVMLLLATAALLSSAISHFVFVWDMTSLLASAHRFTDHIPDVDSIKVAYVPDVGSMKIAYIPDVDSIDVAYALLSQMLNLLGGSIIGGFVFVSARWLKADANRDKPHGAI